MCGISGIYHHSINSPVDRDLLKAMNDKISHRGPDGSGFFSCESLGLGHRRLSIIDLAEGDQPIYNEDGSVVIVFNGEIYNYKELRKELIDKGHHFKTHSDTEVIVHLYEDKGIECLEQLNGMFAFALWDKKKQSLFVARDRLGEKPLYYQNEKGRFTFASELKAILVDPLVERKIDISVVDDYLAYGYVPSPKTIISKVKKLPPAHYLLIENGNVRIEKYWDLSINPPKQDISEAEYKERFRELINDSVKLRLRSDVPVGAFLSGGVDSSFTVALASQQADKPISTFSVGFKEQDFDELSYASKVARQYNTDHHEIILDEIDLTLFPEMVAHFDEPFGDASAIPTYYVTREAAKHVKVCLSGDAGDELFCGYTRYNHEPLEKVLDKIPASLRKAAFSSVAHALPDHLPGKGLLQRMATSGNIRWQGKVGPFSPGERSSLFRPEHRPNISEEWLFKEFFSAGSSSVSDFMLADQATYLPDDILVKVDRNSMWHGLEVRVPFLDHRIVEFANQLPFDLKKRNGVQKYLIKELLKDMVPKEILTRPKKGFGLPLKYWLRDKYYDYSRELLLSPNSACSEYFDPAVIERLIDDNAKGKRDLSRRLWTLMWLEQWLRNFSK